LGTSEAIPCFLPTWLHEIDRGVGQKRSTSDDTVSAEHANSSLGEPVMGMPVTHSGVQRLRGRVNCSPAGFEHNDLMPGSRKLNGCNNSNRAAADNDDVTRRQLRGRYLVKIEDHVSGNLRRRDQ
jgi:hypothetical protein